ncbi:HtaA domain-containing protein [Streptomyces sp. TRM66268-LWL]|uniref:HtaA domain-containing protein n=1 Tax=Streptomyces polyasparticus TaxID=2767826 RepID=A0ABR7SAH9_9ACTN|nr:HtaA domain-containing protein [Streptomyces polyasparticus]MBC9712443.1 HtaA domain-containing protein [Streptomyces polyasparticus]
MSSSRRAARAGAVAGLGALFAALLPITSAHAEDRTVQGGRLDWGIKASFQSYVTGPIAKGSYTLRNGAATAGASQFRFHSAKGSYNPDTGALNAGFSGGVHFLGHKKPTGEYELDLTISRPTVRISGGTGTLYADMVSKAKSTGKVTTSAQVPLASLDLSGIGMKGGGSPIALTNVPATLTSQGANAFAGYYAAGTPLDPVSLSTDVLAGSGSGSGSGSDSDKSGDKDKKDESKKEAKAGRIEDAAVDWGVRRTFREYVTGSIAKGKWALTDGAQDGGALFRFPEGEGSFDQQKQTLDAAFKGSVRFTGEHGLDIELSNFAVGAKSGEATLFADVASEDFTKKKAGLVTFKAKDLKATDGLVTLTEVPSKLTADGAKAFGNMYKAGTAMDPVSLAVALTDKAELPALPDLGSEASAAPEADPKAEKPKTEAAAATSSTSSPALPIGIGAGVLLLAGAAFFVVRKRRTAPVAAASPEGSDSADS